MEPGRLKAAQRGDRAAQRELLDELGPALLVLARRAGPREIEDRLQDLFAHLLSVLPRFDPSGPAKLSTWAFTVAHRWLLMQARKRVPELVVLEGGFPDPSRSPESHASDRQLTDRLEAALTQLPDEQRRIFVLTQLYELPLEVVAQSEQLPIGTVKSRLHRARAALVLLLGDALEAKGGPRVATGRR